MPVKNKTALQLRRVRAVEAKPCFRQAKPERTLRDQTMLQWILISVVALLALLLLVLVLLKRRQKSKDVRNVDFNRYKSQEIHKRGHYHDIVK